MKKISLSVLILAISSGSAFGQQSRSQEGAVLGGVTGAILGGIAGHQNDEAIEGVAIGGVVGAVAGGLLGKSQDQRMIREYQHQQYQRQQHAQIVSQSVSINDAIALCQSGLSPNLIVNQIRTNGVRQRIGVPEIITLHQNGVPEIVIQEMQKARLAGSSQAVAVETRTYVPARPTVVVERRVESYPVGRPPYYGGGGYRPPRNASRHYPYGRR